MNPRNPTSSTGNRGYGAPIDLWQRGIPRAAQLGRKPHEIFCCKLSNTARSPVRQAAADWACPENVHDPFPSFTPASADLLSRAPSCPWCFPLGSSWRVRPLAATYSRGNLSVSIPYHSVRSGGGRLVTEILDPEDHVLGRAEHTVNASNGDGSWQQVIRPGEAHRLRGHRLAARPLPLRVCRQADSRDRGHRVHLADSSPTRRPYPRPDGVPFRKPRRDPGHRLRR